MSDNNDDTPTPKGTGLLKPVDPNEYALGGALPLNMDVGGMAPPKPSAPSMGTTTAQVAQFQFEYNLNSKPYRATIMHNSHTGYSITLEKWYGGTWGPSASGMKNYLLAAFIVQQAVEQMKGQPDVAGQEKQAVKG